MRNILYTTLTVVTAAALLAACKKPDAATSTAPRPITIGAESYAIVTQGTIATGPILSGTLAPKEQAAVRAQIAGSVLRTYAEVGQSVGRGSMLAELDSRAIGDQVTSAQAAVTNARNNLEMAKREEGRQVALKQGGAVADRDVENSHRNTVAAQSALAQAEAQLSAASKQLTFVHITSPIAGKVSMKTASTGDVVQPGAALYTIVDPSSMELEASIPSDQLAMVHVGSMVQFTIKGYPDKSYNGTITRINPTADPATRQIKLYVQIPNQGGALVGDLFAEGRVTTQSHNSLTLPSAAIDRRMMKPAVVKMVGGKVQKVDVQLGLSDDRTDRIEVLSGVQLGDTVLVGAAQEINPGTQIRVVQNVISTPNQSSGKPDSGK